MEDIIDEFGDKICFSYSRISDDDDLEEIVKFFKHNLSR